MNILSVFKGDSSRWETTRMGLRLGAIAATLAGVALAMHLGGPDGAAVPLTRLMGAPTDEFLRIGLGRFIPRLARGIASSGPASVWDYGHVIFCTSIALNWTLIGAGVDLVRWRFGRKKPPETLDAGEPDLLLAHDPLRAEFEDLERAVRERENQPRANARLALV